MGKYDNETTLLPALKAMSLDEEISLAEKIRKDLINNVSKTGGHLASNLGIVELTIALHKVFDTPKDKLIWDVGHQCYVHKMLTGRYEYMDTLRRMGGLSGFPKRAESVHDMYDAGHSGTSISACLGYAKARDLKGEDYSCVAVIGDGALTGGVAWEALSVAGSMRTPLIVVLNDNEMSISRNVGGFAKHLQKLRASKTYLNFKKSIKDSGHSSLEKQLTKFRDFLKYSMLPGIVFEELGFKYFGPVDGHNIAELEEALSYAKTLGRPVLVHVATVKGKGFEPAMKNPSKFHGVGSFDPESVTAEPESKPDSWSEIFGRELVKLACEDESIVAVTAAMPDGTGLGRFRAEYPSRLIDVGIAEQNAVSVAAGMALNGLKPVVALYSTFMQRGYDQIASEICLQNLPVVFAIDRAGVVGSDGETHQGVFDISLLKSLPNMTILSPRDESSLAFMLKYALSLGTPVAIRYPRGNAPKSEGRWAETEALRAIETIKDGKDCLILSDGNMLSESLKAADILAENGVSAAVKHIALLKPLNAADICREADGYSYVICIEDGCKIGGIGEEIAAITSENKLSCKVLSIAWPDKYIEHGTVAQLREKYGMDGKSIAETIGKFIETKA